MIRILVDADLIIEALMNRCEVGKELRELLDRTHPSIQIYITDVGWEKVCAYISRLQNHKIAEIVISCLQEKILICAIDQSILQQARFSPLKDFESAVELVCVSTQKMDAIVTHKYEDFAESPHQCWLWSAEDLWVRANLESQLQASIGSNCQVP